MVFPPTRCFYLSFLGFLDSANAKCSNSKHLLSKFSLIHTLTVVFCNGTMQQIFALNRKTQLFRFRIQDEHCLVTSSSTNNELILEPCQHADVTVNGLKILIQTTLKHGVRELWIVFELFQTMLKYFIEDYFSF